MANDRFSTTAKPPAETGVQAGRPADDRSARPDGPTGEERTLALLCHVGGFMTAFILPLVLWLVKRRDSAFVDHHGKEALNFQLFLTIPYVLLLAAAAVIGVLYGLDRLSSDAALISGLACGGLFVVLMLYETVAVVLASVASLRGRHFRILGNVRFIR